MNKIYIGSTEVANVASGGSGGSGSADLSDYYNKSHIDASYNAIDASMRTFKPIQYTSLDAYETLVDNETVDENMLYVITDVASSDELSTLVTVSDLNAEKQRINASLNETATAVINEANTSIGYWKTTHVNAANTSINSYKNSALSAVQSQQTTSVNAVNSAKTTAISDISTLAAEKIASMKNFVVISDASYGEISTPDNNTIYFVID